MNQLKRCCISGTVNEEFCYNEEFFYDILLLPKGAKKRSTSGDWGRSDCSVLPPARGWPSAVGGTLGGALNV